MGFILVEQTQTSVEHTKFSLLYFVDHNQTMLVEHNHTMPVEHTNVTQPFHSTLKFKDICAINGTKSDVMAHEICVEVI